MFNYKKQRKNVKCKLNRKEFLQESNNNKYN